MAMPIEYFSVIQPYQPSYRWRFMEFVAFLLVIAFNVAAITFPTASFFPLLLVLALVSTYAALKNLLACLVLGMPAPGTEYFADSRRRSQLKAAGWVLCGVLSGCASFIK